jgi:hypothetical protein
VSELRLPRSDGRLERYTLGGQRSGEPRTWSPPAAPLRSRKLYAAAHVVADPLAAETSRATNSATGRACLDWEATMRFRRHLWSWGLGVAEAMDTAQRGMGLDYAATRELISRSASEARAAGGALVCGAGTDQLPAGEPVSLERIIAAYLEQCEHIESEGAGVVLMASRHLAACATGPDDYRRVYDEVLRSLSGPVILHWLGEMFDPALAGYWGAASLDRAMDHCLALIDDHAGKIDGIKLSLLDERREVQMRGRLPEGVRMYTGDDYNYDQLILGDQILGDRTLGDSERHSDALLGIFDGIAPAASAAIQALDEGRQEEYRQILAPTLPLARHIFGAPTYYYKTGLVFLAYLNGHQSHFRMVGGLESARSVTHLSELFVLADRAGLLAEPESAVERMKAFLLLAGVA